MSTLKVRIFDNEAVETLAILFKRSRSAETFERICALMHNLLQSILHSERYAESEDIYQYLYLQMERWILRWVPGRGHLYAYISTATKNAAVSFMMKETLYRQKFMSTDLPLSSFQEGGEFEEQPLPQFLSEDDRAKIFDMLREVESGWAEPEIRGALRHCFSVILAGKCRTSIEKSKVMRYLGAVSVTRQNGSQYNLTSKQAKTILGYAMGVIRTALVSARITEGVSASDIFMVRHRFSPFTTIEQVIGPSAAKRLLIHFAGQTIKFPTLRIQEEATKKAAVINKVIGEDTSDEDFGGGMSFGGTYADPFDDPDDPDMNDRLVVAGLQREISGFLLGARTVYEDRHLGLLTGDDE